MTNKTEWQEANSRFAADQRQQLGDPPTAEEMLTYSRGEMSPADEDRIRDLLAAYPDLARMYAAPFPEEGEEEASDETLAAGLADLHRRLGRPAVATSAAVRPALARRAAARHYIPTTVAAALALVFCGLYVQAEHRARDNARALDLPRILGAAQELESDGNRGPAAATILRNDGEAYLLQLHLLNQVRLPHYLIELHDQNGPVWTSPTADLQTEDTFQLVIPHTFLRPGVRYQLRILGVDGKTRRSLGSYDVRVPVE